MMQTIKIVTWPESQKCMECKYGEFFSSESNYLNQEHICHHPDKQEQDHECPHLQTCFWCGREGTGMNNIQGRDWCGMEDCDPKEDLFDKTDRLHE